MKTSPLLLCVLLGAFSLSGYAKEATYGESMVQQWLNEEGSPDMSSAEKEKQRLSYLSWRADIDAAVEQGRKGELSNALTLAQRARQTADSMPAFNMYEYQHTIELILYLLEKQHKFSEASQLAEEFANKPWGVVASEPDKWLNIAISDASNAGRINDVYRLQMQMFLQSRAWPQIWTIDEQTHRLDYSLAKMSFPLVQDGWVLASFDPADERGDRAEITYIRDRGLDSAAMLSFSVSYREPDYRDPDDPPQGGPSFAQKNLDHWLDYQTKSDKEAINNSLPTLSFPQAVSARTSKVLPGNDEHPADVRARWAVARGEWMLEAQVNVYEDKVSAMTPKIEKLFAALTWDDAPKLYGKMTMKERLDKLSPSSLRMGDSPWEEVIEQATQALNDAKFPYELVQLYGALGIAQYRMNDLQKASQSLNSMMEMQKYSHNGDYSVYDTALKYVADVAWSEGRTERGKELDKAVVTSGFFGRYWAFTQDNTAVVSKTYDLTLPVRIGDFHLEADGETQFYYHNLKTGQLVSLEIEKRPKASTSTPQFGEQLQQYLNRRFLTVETGKASPITLAEGSFAKAGTAWSFKVVNNEYVDGLYLVAVQRGGQLMLLRSASQKKYPENQRGSKAFIEKFVWKSADLSQPLAR